ncbi:MAG: hypothetical protein WC843_00355 [Candidatus Gracilibacteria bacterium]|jgi:hypothetical protein
MKKTFRKIIILTLGLLTISLMSGCASTNQQVGTNREPVVNVPGAPSVKGPTSAPINMKGPSSAPGVTTTEQVNISPKSPYPKVN